MNWEKVSLFQVLPVTNCSVIWEEDEMRRGNRIRLSVCFYPYCVWLLTFYTNDHNLQQNSRTMTLIQQLRDFVLYFIDLSKSPDWTLKSTKTNRKWSFTEQTSCFSLCGKSERIMKPKNMKYFTATILTLLRKCSQYSTYFYHNTVISVLLIDFMINK